MKLEDFRNTVAGVCAECFAQGHTGAPVLDACSRLRPLIAEEPRRQEQQYRVLRDLVERAALLEDRRPYPLYVAVHDLLLREGAFRPPLGRSAQLYCFDEAFYLELYRDVAAAVRDGACRNGFEHFVHCGAREGRTAHPWRAAVRLAPPAPARTAAEAVASNGGSRCLGTAAAVRRVGAPIGVNLIGFHSANLGFGVTVRHYYRFLVEAGLDVCPVEVPVSSGRSGHDTSYADQWLPLHVEAPHAVNLFVMTPKEVDDLLAQRHPAVQLAGKVNVLLPFWELPRLPRPWLPTLNRMDVLVAASAFNKYAMLMDLDGPAVRELPHPLYLPDGMAADRQRFGIPAGAVAFVCCFEMASDINRKNPFAAIAAFEEAFGGDSGAVLIVKVNNPRREPAFEAHLQRLNEAARRCPNIRVFDEVLSYRDVLALFASCDVLVSLHRAEGLGLVMMEAMTLGKPVIATAWSGNMAFTTEENSCLVGYDLEPVRPATQASYGQGLVREDAHWASARIGEAAHWMRTLAADRALRERLGARAKADLADYQRRIDAQELVTTIRNVAARRGIGLT